MYEDGFEVCIGLSPRPPLEPAEFPGIFHLLPARSSEFFACGIYFAEGLYFKGFKYLHTTYTRAWKMKHNAVARTWAIIIAHICDIYVTNTQRLRNVEKRYIHKKD